MDALLLAAFSCGPRAATLAFDLGAGVGPVALSILYRGGAQRVTMVEIDPVAAQLAHRNITANGWGDRVNVLTDDVSAVAERHAGVADLIVCNPPYVEPGDGRVPAEKTQSRARVGPLQAFTDAARQIAGRRARVCFVYPARSFVTLALRLRASGLEPKRMRTVHATINSPARVVLVEATASKPGGLSVMGPLIERDETGYTAEVKELVMG